MLPSISLLGLSAAAFVVPTPRYAAPSLARAQHATMIDIPRITLPDALDGTFKDFDLKNPNTLSQREYNTYSGAAIAGTLALFLPGALIFDVTGVLFNFATAATIGGGLGAFLALADGNLKDISKVANEYGGKLLDVAGSPDIPRITLPDAVAGPLKDLDLKNPNYMSQQQYNTYSGAAIAGTLALFVPGIFIFDVTGFVADFAFSALIGGGLGAFLALRTDGIAKTANEVGGKLIDAVDKVVK